MKLFNVSDYEIDIIVTIGVCSWLLFTLRSVPRNMKL